MHAYPDVIPGRSAPLTQGLLGKGSGTFSIDEASVICIIEYFSHTSTSHTGVHAAKPEAQHMAALRATCSTGLQLLDEAPIQYLRPSAQDHLPPAAVKCARNSLDLQQMLREEYGRRLPNSYNLYKMLRIVCW